MIGILLTAVMIGEGAEVATEMCCFNTPNSRSVSATTRDAVTLILLLQYHIIIIDVVVML